MLCYFPYEGRAMEFPAFRPPLSHHLFTFSPFFYYHFVPENYVHWTEAPEAHIYSANLPGVKKEEIKVEVEDSRYLIIRTEAAGEGFEEPAMKFMRKFRLPEMVDIGGISAKYEDGVLKVTVPRSFVRRGFYIDPADVPDRLQLVARAA